MRIVFLVDGLPCGGKERQLVELVKGLLEYTGINSEKLAVVVMSSQTYYGQAIECMGVRMFSLCRRWRWDPFIAMQLRGIVEKLQPDVLFSFNEMTTFHALAARRQGRPKVIDGSIRNAFPLATLKERLLARFNFWAADRVVANSKAGLTAKGAPAGKSSVLYNGFDMRRLARLAPRDEVRKSLGITGGRAVGMVANFSWKKDWETFFEAARLVRAKRDDVSFVAVGEGEYLEKYRRRFGAEPGIVFTGLRSDVEDIVGVLDVGVLCSTLAEGFPNAVMEYMAAGLPTVVTAGGGSSELVREGETGFIVERKSPALVAEKLLYLLEHEADAQRMGASGRDRIRNTFSMQAAVQRLLQLCRESMLEPGVVA
jgi:glycosyltransferase involved in cell wall biosynthesis